MNVIQRRDALDHSLLIVSFGLWVSEHVRHRRTGCVITIDIRSSVDVVGAVIVIHIVAIGDQYRHSSSKTTPGNGRWCWCCVVVGIAEDHS